MCFGNDWNRNGEYDIQDQMLDFFTMEEIFGASQTDDNDDEE